MATADTSSLYKIDLINLNTCLTCCLPECGYIFPRYLPDCPIAVKEAAKKLAENQRQRLRRRAERAKVQYRFS